MRSSRVRRWMLAVLSTTVVHARAAGQVALGTEFQVNASWTGDQRYPVVASDPAGNFVVLWQSFELEGSNRMAVGVVGRRFDSSGARLGSDFLVNTYTTGFQGYMGVACDATAGFVVTWQSTGQDGSGNGIHAQRYDASGARLGAEFRVNSYTTGNQAYAAVASGAAGGFVVVWQSEGQDGTDYGIFCQRYASSGEPLGAEFRVNTTTANAQSFSSIGIDSTGAFVVVWQSSYQDGSGEGVFGQRFSSEGAPVGGEFRVNSFTAGDQSAARVAANAAGAFVVVWHADGQDGSGRGIFGQRYSSSGEVIGPEFQVNSYTTGRQNYPAVTSDADGSFVVVWMSYEQEGGAFPREGLFGARYASTGERLGAEFRVNTYTTYSQADPFIASGAAGNFVVVWDSDTQDGHYRGIFGQRFCPPLASVSVSTTGSLSVCPNTSAGTANVTDAGGVTNAHQWVYRTSPMGASTPIPGETGTSYVVKGADFAGGVAGMYYLYCRTTPSCGSPMFSTETVMVTVAADVSGPVVTAPPAVKATQTLCQ